MKKFSSLFLLLVLVTVSHAQNIAGDWNGILKIQSTQLRLVLHIGKTDSGYSATMDSPDQNARGIPITMTSFESPVLTFSIANAGISFQGSLDKDEKIAGIFTQGGQSTPLILSKNAVEKEVARRPQEPAKPYPYYAEDVSFENAKDKITLAGTLTLPQKEGNFPAVILITGTGPQNRDEELMGHKPFLVWSDYLTRNGIAVLRFDDRGTYASTGNFSSATSSDFATDVESALAYLETRKEINAKKIGLMGHSEGGLIAPMVASRNKEVAFIVLLAGPGVPGDQLLLLQTRDLAKASGVSSEILDQASKLNKELYEIVKTTKDSAEKVRKLSATLKQAIVDNPAFKKPDGMSEAAFIQPQLQQLTNPWIADFIRSDPAVFLEKVRCPVLAINGSKDLQVSAKENLQGIETALKKGGNKKFVVKEIDGLNHLFQECKTGLPNEYGQIEQTVSPLAMDAVLTWLKGQLK